MLFRSQELKKEIAKIIGVIEYESESKIEINPTLKSTLDQSRLLIEEKVHTPLADLKQAKEPEQIIDTNHLQLPFECPSPKQEDFASNTIPLGKPLIVEFPAPVAIKNDIEAIRIKDNKQINEKISRI